MLPSIAPRAIEIPITTTVRLFVVWESGQLTFLISECVSRSIARSDAVRAAKMLCRVSTIAFPRAATEASRVFGAGAAGEPLLAGTARSFVVVRRCALIDSDLFTKRYPV